MLLVACFVTAVGTAMRGLGGIAPLYLGTLLAGAAIALTQVVTPAWVRAKAAAAGTGVLTGAFSWALVAGATIATFVAIPLERRVRRVGGRAGDLGDRRRGRRRRLAAAGDRAPTTRCHAPVGEPLWRNPMAWSIALLMGLQSMAFFSTITWLPDILVDDGFTRGLRGHAVRDHAARAARAGVLHPGAGRAARRRRSTCWR